MTLVNPAIKTAVLGTLSMFVLDLWQIRLEHFPPWSCEGTAAGARKLEQDPRKVQSKVGSNECRGPISIWASSHTWKPCSSRGMSSTIFPKSTSERDPGCSSGQCVRSIVWCSWNIDQEWFEKRFKTQGTDNLQELQRIQLVEGTWCRGCRCWRGTGFGLDWCGFNGRRHVFSVGKICSQWAAQGLLCSHSQLRHPPWHLLVTAWVLPERSQEGSCAWNGFQPRRVSWISHLAWWIDKTYVSSQSQLVM